MATTLRVRRALDGKPACDYARCQCIACSGNDQHSCPHARFALDPFTPALHPRSVECKPRFTPALHMLVVALTPRTAHPRASNSQDGCVMAVAPHSCRPYSLVAQLPRHSRLGNSPRFPPVRLLPPRPRRVLAKVVCRLPISPTERERSR